MKEFFVFTPMLLGVVIGLLLFLKLRLKFQFRVLLFVFIVIVSCIITLLVNSLLEREEVEDIIQSNPVVQETEDDNDVYLDIAFESKESVSEHTIDEFSDEIQEYFMSWDDRQPVVFADLLYKCAKELDVPLSEVSVADPCWGGEDLHRYSRFNVGSVVVDIYVNTDENNEVYGYLEIEQSE